MNANSYAEELKKLVEPAVQAIKKSEEVENMNKEKKELSSMAEAPMHVEKIKVKTKKFAEEFLRTKKVPVESPYCEHEVYVSVEVAKEIAKGVKALGFGQIRFFGPKTDHGDGSNDEFTFVNVIGVDMSFLWE